MQDADDAWLVAACRQGDATAWEILIRRYQRLIYAIPRRAGLDEDGAAEVFQRVCMALLEHLHTIERPDRLGAWLATTARRESWRQLRGRRTSAIEPLETDEEREVTIVDPALLPDEQLERLERQHEVRLALARLDERCRALLQMLFYRPDPAPYDVVARELQIPEGSIGPTRARCLQKLRRLLEESAG